MNAKRTGYRHSPRRGTRRDSNNVELFNLRNVDHDTEPGDDQDDPDLDATGLWDSGSDGRDAA